MTLCPHWIISVLCAILQQVTRTTPSALSLAIRHSFLHIWLARCVKDLSIVFRDMTQGLNSQNFQS